MKTYIPKPEDVQRKWWVVDAEGKVLGRLASEIATVLRGKRKPLFSPHIDAGDFVVVINADKIRLTGNKEEKKQYFRHTGYMGGEKFIPFKEMIATHPERVIELAVKGMLPKNNLGRLMRRKLKVYAGPNHPHEAQQPQPLEIN